MAKSRFFLVKKTSLIFTTILFIILLGCSQSNEEDRAYNKIMNLGSKYLKNNFDLRVIGIGAGTTDDDQRIIILGFKIYHPIDQREARQLLVDSAEKLKEIANNDESIRPYLTNFPLTEKNLTLSIISFVSKDNQVAPVEPYFSAVYLSEERIVYLTEDPDNFYKYKSSTVENYVDAFAIVQKEREQQPK